MQKTTEVGITGWAFVHGVGSGKAHYFNGNRRSLCGKYGSFGSDFEDDKHGSPDNCGTCKRKLQKIRPELFASHAAAMKAQEGKG